MYFICFICKKKHLKVKVSQSWLTLCDPMEFSRLEYWSEWPFPSPGDLPNPGVEPRSPALQVDTSPAEPQGKPKNTGVGSISLLQWIFPTQESNWEISDWEISIILTCRSLIHSSPLSICYLLPYIQFLSQQMNFLIFLGSSL